MINIIFFRFAKNKTIHKNTVQYLLTINQQSYSYKKRKRKKKKIIGHFEILTKISDINRK